MEKKVKVLDVEANLFIKRTAEKLKPLIKIPEWAKYVKTSAGSERPPEQPDWWYYRAASILRKIYLKGIVGVERLRKSYKRKKKHKAYPAKVFKGSGKIIREILKQLEQVGLVCKVEKPKKGRQLTKKGLEFLENIAKELKTK